MDTKLKDCAAVAVELLGIPCWSWDLVTDERWWSAGMCDLLAYPRTTVVTTQTWEAAVHPDDLETSRQAFMDALQSDATEWSMMLRLRSSTGGWLEVINHIRAIRDDAGGAIRVTGAIDNVTSRRELEQRLSTANRAESLGRLAGGIAHDFNNMLTVVLGYTDILEQNVSSSYDVDPLRAIRQAAGRAAELANNLLAYARKQPLADLVVDVNELILTTQPLLVPLLGEEIRLNISLAEEPVCVCVDPVSFEQVLVNLVLNARDAVVGQGEITISSRSGDRVAICVCDDGTGVDPDVLPRVFEPYFTTKGVGGTGLGLAICKDIVDKSGGELMIESETGRGTKVTIQLPSVERVEPHGSVTNVSAGAEGHGAETILIVEDDPLIRELVRTVLRQRGYQVFDAATAEEAQVILATESSEIHLLFTDVDLPGSSGPALLAEVREQRPDMQVIYSSGQTGSRSNVQDLSGTDVTLIRKPYRPLELVARIREVFDGVRKPNGETSQLPGL